MSNSPRKLTLLLVIALCLIASFAAQSAPPVSTDDKASTQLNTPILIDVLSNDTSTDPLVTGTVNIKRPYRKGIVALRSGQVRFIPKTGFVGDEAFSYTVRDIAGFISDPATVTVTVNGDPTDITLSANSLAENNPAGTTVGNFTTTDPNTADTHTYTLVVGAGSTDNAAFQISGNSLQTASVLDFETKSNYSIRVRSTDSGAGNLFFEKVFTITVTDLNEAPVFTITSATSVNEDAGSQTINAFATGINDGDAGNQTLAFTVTGNTNALLFAIAPAISPTGILTYTAAANAFGSATISVRLTDNGSGTAPNVNQTAIQTFTITVNPVNDAPSFTASNPPAINEDSGSQSVIGWASFNPGPNEGTQTVLSYTVSNISNSSLFSAAPSIDNNGTLSYTPAPNANGTSTFDVVVRDNGTTANGGVDTSVTQTFTITVNPLNDAPVAANKSFSAQTNMKIGLSGLLAGVTDADNSINGCSPTFSVAGISNQVGGSFTVTNASTGAFDFDPNPGFTGSASATFTVQDNGCPGVATSAPAIITVAVGGTRIWFVNASATGGSNDGRLSNPFTSLASVENVDTTNDRIFVFSGTYPTGLLALFDGEQLIGQGVSGTDFDTLFGITPPAGTIARPSINGTRPILQDTVTLANNNVVRGLNISTTGKTALVDILPSISNVTVNEVIASSNSTTVFLSDIASGNIVLDSTTSTGGANNVNLSNVAGTVNLGGGALSGATGISFNVATGTGTISYSGAITQSTNGQRPVLINGKTGGSVTFSGAITANTGSTAGISLTSNTGATVTFQGGMSLSTGSNTAFSATGGGTVNVCDDNPCNSSATGALANTLTTTTNAALNVANTTIGSNRLEFRSISSNGAANGIALNSTGSSGGLTVTGDSGSSNNGSGGTIQNTTGAGISLTSTQNVVLDQMNIQSTGDSGINGTTVTNFAFTNGTINNSGNLQFESNISFNGLGTATPQFGNNISGTLTVTGSTLTNAFESGLEIQSDNGTVTNATITGNTITSSTSQATSKGDGVKLIGTGNASTRFNLNKATISNNTISNFPNGAGIQVNISNTIASGPGATAGIPNDATNIVSITGNTIRGQNSTNRLNFSAIIYTLSGANSGSRTQGNADISNNGSVANPLTNMVGTGILVGNNGFTTMTVSSNNNVIVSNNTLGANGIGGGNGVSGTGNAWTPDLTMTTLNNTISANDGNDILLVGRQTSGIAKLGIRNNNVAAPLAGVRPGIRVDSGNSSSSNAEAVCLDISGNTSAGSGGTQGIGLRRQSSTVPAVSTVFGVEGMSATASPGIESFVNGLNPSGNGTLLISATTGFTNCSSAP